MTKPVEQLEGVDWHALGSALAAELTTPHPTHSEYAAALEKTLTAAGVLSQESIARLEGVDGVYGAAVDAHIEADEATDADECETCDIAAWEHCGNCLCCPDLPRSTYAVAAVLGVTPSDLARAIYEGENAGVSADEAVTAAIDAASP